MRTSSSSTTTTTNELAWCDDQYRAPSRHHLLDCCLEPCLVAAACRRVEVSINSTERPSRGLVSQFRQVCGAETRSAGNCREAVQRCTAEGALHCRGTQAWASPTPSRGAANSHGIMPCGQLLASCGMQVQPMQARSQPA